MKNLILKSLLGLSLLLLMSVKFPYPKFQDCFLNIRYEMQIETKKMNSGKQDLNTNMSFRNTEKNIGNLELCVMESGNCEWVIEDQAELQSIAFLPGIEDLIMVLRQQGGDRKVDYNSFLNEVARHGAEISDLGNGSVSVRRFNKKNQESMITLIDINKNRLIGMSCYDKYNLIRYKMICGYHPNNRISILDNAAFTFFNRNRLGENILDKELVISFSDPEVKRI